MKSLLPHSRWNKQIHVSWFIAWISVAILLGIAIAPETGSQFSDTSWFIVGISLAAMALIKHKVYIVPVAIIAGIIFGLCRGSLAHNSLADYQPYMGKYISLEGRVSEDTSYGPKGDLRLRLDSVYINNRSLPGNIWVSTAEHADIKRGDIVSMKGVLGKGFGNIPASMFKGQIMSIQRPNPGDVGRRVRDWFGKGVSHALSQDEANLAMAYLVGQKLTVSDTFADQLRTVGLIHAVVASGYHLTVLVGVIRRFFVRVSKYLSTLLSGGVIIGFILITGFSPSMSRAGLVSGLSLIAWYYGRVIHPLVLLPFAAACTALVKPEYVWGDIGWYLSFSAFTGVILIAPLVHRYFWGKKRPGVLREILVATFCAQLITLPLTIHAFGYYSAYAMLANLLVVPLIPLTMLLTFVSGIIGLILPGLAHLFGIPVSLILQYMKIVIGWIAHLPGAKTEISFGMGAVIASYAMICLFTYVLWWITHYDYRDTKSEKLL